MRLPSITIMAILSLSMTSHGKATKPIQYSEIQKANIKKMAKDHHVETFECFDNYSKLNPVSKGHVLVKIVANDNGQITSLSAKKNTFKDKEIFNCISERIKSWTLPPAPKGKSATMDYLFEFNTK